MPPRRRERPPRYGLYQLKGGDTPLQTALRFAVPIALLLRSNPHLALYDYLPGIVVRIPIR